MVVWSVTNAFAISVSHFHLNLHFYFDIYIYISSFFLLPIYLNYLAAFENFPHIKYQLIKIAQKHINKIYCYSCRTHTHTQQTLCVFITYTQRVQGWRAVSVKLNVKNVLKIKHKYLLRAIGMPLPQGIRMRSLGSGKILNFQAIEQPIKFHS